LFSAYPPAVKVIHAESLRQSQHRIDQIVIRFSHPLHESECPENSGTHHIQIKPNRFGLFPTDRSIQDRSFAQAMLFERRLYFDGHDY
jgi:hypothetical protein